MAGAAAKSPQLRARYYAQGLMRLELDVIGNCLTEINVTSPTCMQEIADQTSFNAAAMMIDAIEKTGKD